jgi:chemotaxis protein CheD
VTVPVQAYLAQRQRPAETEKQFYLHPGRFCFTAEDLVVSTVLGSCVSVCLFAEEYSAAGVNHFLLPERSSRKEPARFGDSANELLLEQFQNLGMPLSKLRAKVFGGASMGGSRAGDLASRNVEVAIAFLDRHNIRIVSQDTGGERGRKLLFRTSDATAWVRLL